MGYVLSVTGLFVTQGYVLSVVDPKTETRGERENE